MIDNEQYEMSIERPIKTGKNEPDSFIQKCVFTIQINEIVIKTCGKIGYIIKLTKMGQSTYRELPRQEKNTNTITSLDRLD